MNISSQAKSHVLRPYLAVFFTLLPFSSFGQVKITEKEQHATCAAANALLAVKAEPGMYRDLFAREAKRHADAARALGATDSDLEGTLRGLRMAYEDGAVSWAEIADSGKECTKV